MKAKTIFSAVIIALSLSAISATNKTNDEQKQCGVTNVAIQRYLETCSHHHTVYYVQDIPGTCNSLAGIEGCGTATVYVSDGIITGHLDAAGYCN